jgi:hypothetical protein
MMWSRRQRVLKIAATAIAVAAIVGVAAPASANTSALSGTSYENAWYNYSTVRTNAQGANSVNFQWNYNDLGGGGLQYRLRAYSSGTQITPTYNAVSGAVNSLTYSPGGTTKFPNGSFTIEGYTSAACGGLCGGTGYVTFHGNIWWNLPW